MTGRIPDLPRMLALAAMIAVVLSAPIRAEDGAGETEWPEHDRARQLLERGEIRPLDEILARLAVSHPGEVVSIGLDRQAGRWVYELKIVTEAGRRIEIEIDAATMAVIRDEPD